MKNKLSIMAAVALLVGMSQPLQAIPISGTVDMSGTAFLNNVNLGLAGAATSFSGVTVGGIPTGSFTGTAGASVTWSPFGWAPSTTPVLTLWTYVSGARTYSFRLNSVSVISQTSSFLNLSGVGVLSISGVGPTYDPTGGLWSFTISNAGGGNHANFAFTFANSQTGVPDGGTTVLLLGAALAGLGLLKKKLTA